MGRVLDWTHVMEWSEHTLVTPGYEPFTLLRVSFYRQADDYFCLLCFVATTGCGPEGLIPQAVTLITCRV